MYKRYLRDAGVLYLTTSQEAVFVSFTLLMVRPVLAYADRYIPSRQVLPVLSMVLLLFSAYTTSAIGIHPVFGAFLMGVILPRRTAFILLLGYR